PGGRTAHHRAVGDADMSCAMTALTQTLAQFVTGTSVSSIPLVAIERAKMSLASTIASAAAGYDIDSARIVRCLELEEGGAGQATAWFHGVRVPLTKAVRINAVASDAAASDDSDMRSIAH